MNVEEIYRHLISLQVGFPAESKDKIRSILSRLNTDKIKEMETFLKKDVRLIGRLKASERKDFINEAVTILNAEKSDG